MLEYILLLIVSAGFSVYSTLKNKDRVYQQRTFYSVYMASRTLLLPLVEIFVLYNVPRTIFIFGLVHTLIIKTRLRDIVCNVLISSYIAWSLLQEISVSSLIMYLFQSIVMNVAEILTQGYVNMHLPTVPPFK